MDIVKATLPASGAGTLDISFNGALVATRPLPVPAVTTDQTIAIGLLNPISWALHFDNMVCDRTP